MAKAVKRGTPPPADGAETTRRIFLSGLGVVLLVAHLSLWTQLSGLIGPDGILPSGDYLVAVQAALVRRGLLPAVADGGVLAAAWSAVRRLAVELYWVPTLGWVLPPTLGPQLLAAVGTVASALVAARVRTAPMLLVAWATYLSLSVLGQDFLTFQWDALLVEVSLAAVLIAPWGRAARFAAAPAGWWLLRWILFRLVFFGGLVKLTSGDPTWRDLSAMTYHYATQPLPNPLSPWAHALPGWIQALSTLVTFVVELVLVFGIFAGRTGRLVAFAAIVLLMVLLALTGNYGFFQLLTIVLATTLLDDGHWARLLRGHRAPALPPLPRERSWAPTAFASVLIAISVVTALPRYVGVELPEGVRPVTGFVGRARLVNHYGLFAVMTTTRPIPVLEARWGEGAWTEVTWRWQTSDPGERPRQVAPHMPRLDWQLWFAGLAGSCERAPWTMALMERVLKGSGPVDDLIGDLRLRTGRPPDAVRMRLYDYTMQPPGAPTPWTRELLGEFCPEVTREDLGLRAIGAPARSGDR